ncbi:MAG: hypothetical protein ACI8P9_000960 [Parasphingorhabdus sp.]|jgi:hypothetical protein
MNKILGLWATPRSTSTAFEKVMDHRGDMTCFHEPYNEAFYFGEERRVDRYFKADPELKPTKGLTLASVHKKMAALAETDKVFIKDFAYSIIHIADEQFLDAFTHTFLIRNPEKVLTSMHSRWPDVALGEIGFEDLHTLFTRIADKLGKAPPVIDSDELLDNVNAGMRAYCESAGITFIPEAMNWQGSESIRENPTWNNDEHGFHDSLKSSKGFMKQKREYPPLSSSADMIRLYEASMPHYESLFKHRLKF